MATHWRGPEEGDLGKTLGLLPEDLLWRELEMEGVALTLKGPEHVVGIFELLNFCLRMFGHESL